MPAWLLQDAESELVVQEALDSILQKKKVTTIVIAHRLSTIRNADKINVVVSGQIKERGTHDELMSSETYYKTLVQKQEGSGNTEGGSSSHGSSLRPSDAGPVFDTYGTEDGTLVPHIEFKDVRFAYPTRPKKVIFDNFNLAIKKGQTVALVGPSGRYRSAILQLFYFDKVPTYT